MPLIKQFLQGMITDQKQKQKNIKKKKPKQLKEHLVVIHIPNFTNEEAEAQI